MSSIIKTPAKPAAVCGAWLLITALHTFLPAAPCAADPAPAATAMDEVLVDRDTADLIRGALKYLASQQQPNGSWTEGNRDAWVTAITGYALMAFLASGHLPTEGEHAKTVAAGTQFLLDSLQSDGKFVSARRSGQYMYGHGIATIVLGELYGQTKSPAIRAKLEAAIQLILDSQNKEGGWRYHPFPKDADISVTVLQVVALRSAKNAGLDVPQKTLEAAVQYLHNCYEPGSGGFCYQPGKKGAGFARTAAAIYSLQVLGRYDDPQVLTGSEYLTKKRKDHDGHYTYGQFYAAPAQYMIGGATWKNWYEQIRAETAKSARRQGDLVYWNPDDKSPGPIYVTAVHATILAMPYHYLPLYQR
jgi:prenyltransferase beta subunit